MMEKKMLKKKVRPIFLSPIFLSYLSALHFSVPDFLPKVFSVTMEPGTVSPPSVKCYARSAPTPAPGVR